MKNILVKTANKLLSEKSYLAARFFYKHKKLPDLDNPITFSEKVTWSKLACFDPVMTVCADKYAVRDYVSRKVPSNILIPLVGHFSSAEAFEQNYDKLPNSFALKAAHGSGWNEIVFDKSSSNKQELVESVKNWLAFNYYDFGLEKQYKDIPPSVVVEELLLDSDGKVPSDYKIYCFGKGGCKKIIIQVDLDRFGEHTRAFFDENWEQSDVAILSSKSKLYDGMAERPKGLEQMVTIARKLSSDFEFSRIDLYNNNGKIYFGEITYHPESGYGMYLLPEKYEYELGKLIYN